LNPVDWGLIVLPFAAGLVVLASHVPLGREVLRRGIVFVDLAVAQIAGLGVVAAHALDWHPSGWETQLAAGGTALAGAALLAWLERHWPDILEPLIGALFVLAASLAALLAAGDPHGGEHLRDLLVGQILWVGWAQLLPALALTLILLMAWWRLVRRWPWMFHVCLALAVTASVQLVGVYLVFASLILPALAVRRRPGRSGLLRAGLAGGAGYLLGLLVSAAHDLPAGPLIVLALVLTCLAWAALERRGREADHLPVAKPWV
jgi:zinc/manganese transport system permease protein